MTDKTILKVTAIIAVLTSATIAGVFGFAALSSISSQFAFAQKQGQFFDAKLTGKDEVPSKDTKASGVAEFTVRANSMSYKVTVNNMEKVTAAHIHQGKVGENGPVVVTLFKTDSPSATTNGVLSQGTITSDKFEGQLAGKRLSDLINMINNGEAYVNVHTQANPKGEIRGQLSSM
jgi:CHRD domain-containing protein